MRLPRAVEQRVHDRGIDVAFYDRAITGFWNRNRKPGEPIFYTGYYWVIGRREGGPFRSYSAAVRDAYVRICLNDVLRTPNQGRK